MLLIWLIFIKIIFKDWETALHASIKYNHYEVSKYLVQKNSDLESQDLVNLLYFKNNFIKLKNIRIKKHQYIML
jgi:hypothetical protein